MNDYDISNAFRRIENLLIKSMMDNFKNHRVKDDDWESWQVIQLKELEKYRKENSIKFDDDFKEINDGIKKLFRTARRRGYRDADTLRGIIKSDFSDSKFGINERQLTALIKSTEDDLTKAEHAVLRKANDDYRKIIFDAQLFAETGGSYEQAVDMATKEFHRRGITSIVYRNGSQHTIEDYARMAIRTGSKRAYLMGLGEKMNELGIHTVIVHRRNGACPLCAEWLGEVLVDDVYSGGTIAEAKRKGYPLLSQAMEEGFLHPNCRDTYSIYIEGVTKREEPLKKRELDIMADQYNLEQNYQRCKDMAESYKSMADNALDKSNQKNYRTL